MTKAVDRELIVRGLLNDDDERIRLYHYNPVFHTEIDTLAIFMEQVVDGFEAKAVRDEDIHAKAHIDALLGRGHPVHGGLRTVRPITKS